MNDFRMQWCRQFVTFLLHVCEVDWIIVRCLSQSFFLLPIPEIEDMGGRLFRYFSANNMERISCVPPHGHPKPVVWWEKDGARVPTKGRVHQQDMDLIFNPAVVGDSGTYVCMAQNKAGQRRQEVTVTVAGENGQILIQWLITLCVLFKRSSSNSESIAFYSVSYASKHSWTSSLCPPGPPEWVNRPQDTEMEEGQPGYLHCRIQATPPAQVTWYRNMQEISEEVRVVFWECIILLV